jgi:hypothetical protein
MKLFDLEVREAMHAAVTFGFLLPRPAFAISETLGMFSDEADRVPQ